MSRTALVDAQTLRDHLDDPQWIVVDCRFDLAHIAAGENAYASAHLPGARYAHLDRDLSGEKTGSNGRHPLPDPVGFAALLAAYGASDASQIIAYDNGGDMFAARFWFLCRWIGHESVAVLDGGLNAWKDAGFPLTTDVPKPTRGRIAVGNPLDQPLDARAVRDALDNASATLLDARAPDRYAGATEPLDPVAGHIPTARNRFFKENFAANGRWKSPDELRAAYASYGDASSVVNYCGSGVSAAVNLLSMHAAGLKGARIYPGSWSEWCANPNNPTEKS